MTGAAESHQQHNRPAVTSQQLALVVPLCAPRTHRVRAFLKWIVFRKNKPTSNAPAQRRETHLSDTFRCIYGLGPDLIDLLVADNALMWRAYYVFRTSNPHTKHLNKWQAAPLMKHMIV